MFNIKLLNSPIKIITFLIFLISCNGVIQSSNEIKVLDDIIDELGKKYALHDPSKNANDSLTIVDTILLYDSLIHLNNFDANNPFLEGDYFEITNNLFLKFNKAFCIKNKIKNPKNYILKYTANKELNRPNIILSMISFNKKNTKGVFIVYSYDHSDLICVRKINNIWQIDAVHRLIVS